MFKSYLKIAWRNGLRNKTQSLINIIGLSIGLACVCLIAVYIKTELQYDQQFSDAERIFRVNLNGKMGEEEFYAGYTPPPAGKALMANFPEIERYTRIHQPGEKMLKRADIDQANTAYNENGILSVDSNFLQLLNYPMSKGSPEHCLLHPKSIVLKQAMVRKYFGNEDPMGKTIQIEGDDQPYTVTGIVEESKTPHSLSFDFLIPIANQQDVQYFDWSWVWLNVATYVKFKEHVPTDPAAIKKLESKFPEMMKQQAAGAFDRIGQPYDEFLEKGGKWDLSLQPLTAIHLYSSNIISTVTDQGNIQTVYFFAVIALLILVLACVNFMNLTTAGAVRRAKEIGVRKVVGSTKGSIAKQFYMEALLLSLLSGLIALLLVYLALPYFNELIGKSIALDTLWRGGGWILFLLLICCCALFSGSYPALYISRFKPIIVLKGQGTNKIDSGNKTIRGSLIVFQFAISIILIIASITVYQQLKFTQIHDLGLDKENVIIIPNANRLGSSQVSFREEVKKTPNVVNASISTGVPGKGAFGDFYIPLPNDGDEPAVKDITLNSYLTDDDLIKSLGISMASGDAFEKGFDNSRTVLINETAAKRMGYKNPIGKFIKYPGGNAAESYQIIGVMKDFNTASLHSPIIPFALFHETSKSYDLPSSFLVIRVKPGDLSPTLKTLGELWKTFSPSAPFEFKFLRDDLAMQYDADQRTAKVIGIFTALSVVIACIGLLGMIMFAAQQRTKEIGIRKVLGATVSGIVTLLSKDFIKLVLIALLIASPIAWWAMNKWLEDFAYRITIQWWMFALAGFTALAIALLTVSFQAIKAALTNPVDSLRDE